MRCDSTNSSGRLRPLHGIILQAFPTGLLLMNDVVRPLSLEANSLIYKMEGYPKLAALQGRYLSLSIYRRFSTLNARNLLYLQAELMVLESNLDLYTLKDFTSSDEDEKARVRNWYRLSESDDGVHSSQWHTMLAVRSKLKEYNECLIQARQLAEFDSPGKGDLHVLQGWLNDPNQGACAFDGTDAKVWHDGKDLLVVIPNKLNDAFTRWIPGRIFRLYHNLFASRQPPPDEENQLYYYEGSSILRAADIIGTLFSSMMPVFSIVVLYCVHNMWIRLGLVGAFTLLLSMALVFITRAKRIEIFAATAAFASVLVVFVGGTAGTN